MNKTLHNIMDVLFVSEFFMLEPSTMLSFVISLILAKMITDRLSNPVDMFKRRMRRKSVKSILERKKVR